MYKPIYKIQHYCPDGMGWVDSSENIEHFTKFELCYHETGIVGTYDLNKVKEVIKKARKSAPHLEYRIVKLTITQTVVNEHKNNKKNFIIGDIVVGNNNLEFFTNFNPGEQIVTEVMNVALQGTTDRWIKTNLNNKWIGKYWFKLKEDK